MQRELALGIHSSDFVLKPCLLPGIQSGPARREAHTCVVACGLGDRAEVCDTIDRLLPPSLRICSTRFGRNQCACPVEATDIHANHD